MKSSKVCLLMAFSLLFMFSFSVLAMDIGGPVSSTLKISENSRLVSDVTCTVVGLPCISIAAPNVVIDLNGFTMTGRADAQTACNGGPSTFVATMLEDGIDAQGQSGVAVYGPGLIQRFRGPGIFINGGNAAVVNHVTVSTNCYSGILVGGGSGHQIADNISVRNGNGSFACGGI